jgi:hypothetical protein
MAAFVLSRWVYNPGDVTARREDEPLILPHQIFRTKRALPRDDMILSGGEDIERYFHRR